MIVFTDKNARVVTLDCAVVGEGTVGGRVEAESSVLALLKQLPDQEFIRLPEITFLNACPKHS